MTIEIITLLLSGGGVAIITALVKAWRTIKQGAKTDEQDYLSLVEERMALAEADRDLAISVAHYWMQRAGVLEYYLVRATGPDSVPTFPKEPSLDFSYKEKSDTKVSKRAQKRAVAQELEEE